MPVWRFADSELTTLVSDGRRRGRRRDMNLDADVKPKQSGHVLHIPLAFFLQLSCRHAVMQVRRVTEGSYYARGDDVPLVWCHPERDCWCVVTWYYGTTTWTRRQPARTTSMAMWDTRHSYRVRWTERDKMDFNWECHRMENNFLFFPVIRFSWLDRHKTV